MPYVKAKAGKLAPLPSMKALAEGNYRFTYDSRDGTFRFLKQTIIHSSGSQWLIDWVRKMEHSGIVNQDTLTVYSNTDLQTFQGAFTGR